MFTLMHLQWKYMQQEIALVKFDSIISKSFGGGEDQKKQK